MSYIIAIDGPAGSGKSTISKIVAKDLDFLFISSGQLYRICAYYFLESKLDEVNPEFIKKLNELKITYSDGNFLVNKQNLGDKLITNQVASKASFVATNNDIREFVNQTIRNVFQDKNIIMDGRDIGTVVFPNATLKIFLSASIISRVKRRKKELKEKNIANESFFKMFFAIWKRDRTDKHRKIAPLKKAKDAIKIDTSNKTIDQVVNEVKTLFESKRGSHE